MKSTATMAPTVVKKVEEKIEIRIARSLPEVEALRDSWSSWGGHRDSDIDFYLMIVKSYSEVIRPHVITLYKEGKPVAVLVGRLERKRLAFNIGYLRAFRPRVRCLTFVYGAMHGDGSPENIQILVGEVRNSLKRNEADVALLEFVPVDSPLYHSIVRPSHFRSRHSVQAAQGHYMMKLPDSVEQIYGRMSAKHRKNLRREIRQLFSQRETRIRCYESMDELDEMFQNVEEIAKKTYQRGLGAGFIDNLEVRERLGLAAQKGWLRANVLYIGDRPIAFWIGMLYNGSFVSEYLGYDPEFRRLSPGMVLIMKVIEGFCGRVTGNIVNELDFGLGHAEYKLALSDKNWLEAPLYIFSPTLRGLSLNTIRTITSVIDRCARKVLISTNLLPQLKKAWRDRLARKAKLQRGLKGSGASSAVHPTANPGVSS